MGLDLSVRQICLFDAVCFRNILFVTACALYYTYVVFTLREKMFSLITYYIACYCCGASAASEQQYNQDLREIYKVGRILELITFYHNALHLTRFFTRMHCI